MEIEKVIVKEDGNYIVNDVHTVPDDMSMRHRRKVQAWIDAGNTPMPYVGPTALELWEQAMAQTDSTGIPRWFEDYVTENSIVLAPGRAKDNYDAKVALRATKPGV